jgi:hypothetical protein
LKRGAGIDRHGHQLAVGRQVVQLAAVVLPFWFDAALRGDLPSAAVRIGKRLDDNLVRARVVGDVGVIQPSADPRLRLVEGDS